MNRNNRNPCIPACPPEEDDDFDFIFPCDRKVDGEAYLRSLQAEICELEQRRNEICGLEQRRNEMLELEQSRVSMTKLKAEYCKMKAKADLCETAQSKEDTTDSKKKSTCIVEINGKSYEMTEAAEQTKPKPDKLPPCAFTITPVKEDPPPCPQAPPVVVLLSDKGNPLADVEERKRAVVIQAQNTSSFTILQYDNLIQQIINLLVDIVEVEVCGSQLHCKKERMLKELREVLISVTDKKVQQLKLDALQKDLNKKQAQLQTQLNNAQNDADNRRAQLQSQVNDLNTAVANCCKPAPTVLPVPVPVPVPVSTPVPVSIPVGVVITGGC